MDEESKICIAEISKAHGIAGAFKVRLYNERSNVFQKGKIIYFEDDSAHKIVKVQSSNKGLIIRLEDVKDRNASELLVSKKIFVKNKDLEKTDESENYAFDLIDCKIVESSQKGEIEYGVVTSIVDNPAHELLLISSKNKEFLIPFIKEYIAEVDLENKTIHALNIESLSQL